MYQRLHNQFGTAGMILSVVAIVLALAGGAIAASGGKPGPRGKQGKPGKTGAAGATGAAGPTGPAGAKGDPGTAGTNGTNGTDGESVTNTKINPGGSKCEGQGGAEFKVGAGTPTTACNGTTGFTKTLPIGETETGTWITEQSASGENHELRAISFAIPLAAPLANNHAFYVTTAEQENETNPDCLGTVEAPAAEEGFLCIYQGVTNNPFNKYTIEVGAIFRPGEALEFSQAAGVAGAEFIVNIAGEEGYPHYTGGSWAVTAD